VTSRQEPVRPTKRCLDDLGLRFPPMEQPLDTDGEAYLAIGAEGFFDPRILAVILTAVPGIAPDDWIPEPKGAFGLEPRLGEILYSTLIPPTYNGRFLTSSWTAASNCTGRRRVGPMWPRSNKLTLVASSQAPQPHRPAVPTYVIAEVAGLVAAGYAFADRPPELLRCTLVPAAGVPLKPWVLAARNRGSPAAARVGRGPPVRLRSKIKANLGPIWAGRSWKSRISSSGH
jgi:hypothetical protein